MSFSSKIFITDATFPVSVFDQKNQIFKGEVWGISSINEKGPFSMRVLHGNFITVIQDELVLWSSAKNQQKIIVDRGILRCFDQKVEIYLGISGDDDEPEAPGRSE